MTRTRECLGLVGWRIRCNPKPRHGACTALAPRLSRPLSGSLLPRKGNHGSKGDGGWVEVLARRLTRCHRVSRASACARQRELVTHLSVGT
eukprot:6172507-Pleurochrysis_carterae.AAC.1